MTDTASLFSTTPTLVNGASNTNAPSRPLDYVKPEDCFTVLLLHHDTFKLDANQFNESGFPAVYDRLDGPSSTRSGLKKLALKKRLQVQFPKEVIKTIPTFRRKDITTLDQVIKRREEKKSSLGKRRTMFDMMEDDLVSIQTRRLMDMALTMLFSAREVNSPILYYHASNINYMPAWAVDKNNPSFAAVPAQWATICFMEPQKEFDDNSTIVEGQVEQEEDEEPSVERGNETDEQVFKRIFVPDQASEITMRRLLSHLESRGAMWARVGRYTKPTMANPSPRSRAEYTVIGVFPKPFTQRCLAYRQAKKPWVADTTEPAKSKLAPLILSTDGSGNPIEHDAGQTDFLEGWKIRMTKDEPARTGSYWEDAGGITMAFAGGVGGGF